MIRLSDSSNWYNQWIVGGLVYTIVKPDMLSFSYNLA